MWPFALRIDHFAAFKLLWAFILSFKTKNNFICVDIKVRNSIVEGKNNENLNGMQIIMTWNIYKNMNICK